MLQSLALHACCGPHTIFSDLCQGQLGRAGLEPHMPVTLTCLDESVESVVPCFSFILISCTSKCLLQCFQPTEMVEVALPPDSHPSSSFRLSFCPCSNVWKQTHSMLLIYHCSQVSGPGPVKVFDFSPFRFVGAIRSTVTGSDIAASNVWIGQGDHQNRLRRHCTLSKSQTNT